MKEPEEPQEYVVFPEAAIKYLPEEWQKHLDAIKKEGQGILEAVRERFRHEPARGWLVEVFVMRPGCNTLDDLDVDSDHPAAA